MNRTEFKTEEVVGKEKTRVLHSGNTGRGFLVYICNFINRKLKKEEVR